MINRRLERKRVQITKRIAHLVFFALLFGASDSSRYHLLRFFYGGPRHLYIGVLTPSHWDIKKPPAPHWWLLLHTLKSRIIFDIILTVECD